MLMVSMNIGNCSNPMKTTTHGDIRLFIYVSKWRPRYQTHATTLSGNPPFDLYTAVQNIVQLIVFSIQTDLNQHDTLRK